MEKNRVTKLLGIQYPIIQAGMVWTSGWRLAAAVSQSGALGVIGSGSMYPNILEEHILKYKEATSRPFAVNIPLLYADVPGHLEVILKHHVPIVITSAGNPATHTAMLKEHGIKVMHVVGSSKFARKAQQAGCDAVIAEGFEAGGHNGREETTTFILIPLVKEAVTIPVIAAGGIATGAQILAAMALGAEGVQIGSRFVASEEASSHPKFKNAILNAGEGATMLTLKELVPVRVMKNSFYEQIQAAYAGHASVDELRELLGKRRAKRGIFEGDLDEGELEIGQVIALLKEIKPAAEIIRELLKQFREARTNIQKTDTWSLDNS